MHRLIVTGVGLAAAAGMSGAVVLGAAPGSERDAPHTHSETSRVDSAIYIVPSQSVDEVLDSATAVVLGTPISRETDYWPPSDPEIHVVAQFRFRVDEVLSGDFKPGEEIIVQVPGGTMALWGNPQKGGSFRPREGEETHTVEYPEFPFYSEGRPEVVFLQPSAVTNGARAFVAVPNGRYELRSERLVSRLEGDPTEAHVYPSSDLRSVVVGKTLSELRGFLAPRAQSD